MGKLQVCEQRSDEGNEGDGHFQRELNRLSGWKTKCGKNLNGEGNDAFCKGHKKNPQKRTDD
jgi:hypothetical protein